MVKFLLEHGANVFLTDISNKLACDVTNADNIKTMLYTAMEQKAYKEATKMALEEEKAEAEWESAYKEATKKALEESEQTVKVPCIKVVNIPKGNADTGDDNMIKLTITLKGQTAIVAKALKALNQIDSSN